MRRRDKGGAGVGGQTHAGGNVDAVVGDGHPNHVPIAKQAVENGGNAGVGGIFDRALSPASSRIWAAK